MKSKINTYLLMMGMTGAGLAGISFIQSYEASSINTVISLIIWCLTILILRYRAQHLRLGITFWVLPSTWLALGPVLQLYIPVLLFRFGLNTLPVEADVSGVDESMLYWSVTTALMVLGAAIVEPYRTLMTGFNQFGQNIPSSRFSPQRLTRAAVILLLAGVAARASQGGISIGEIQTTVRIIGESAAEVNTRVTMFIVPLLALSTSLFAYRLAIAMKQGIVPASVAIQFWFSLLVATGYHILLGSRGGVLFSVIPSVLTITLLLDADKRRRFLIILGLVFLSLMFVANSSRAQTAVLLVGINYSSMSFFDLASALFEGFNNSIFAAAGLEDGSFVTFIRRIGTGWILSNLIENPGSFPKLEIWSFPWVYTVAFPSSLSPWNALIPYPTDQGIFDLGYIMGEFMTGISGVGTAVPPQAEIYWRFGWLLAFPVAILWGVSIALIFRFWTSLLPEAALFLALYFSIQIGLCETSWVLIANLVRNPILLFIALHFARYRMR